jgi:sec-independent protein translocase protein TatB
VLDLSPDKLVMLAVVAMVVLGPNRLPGAARSVGRFFGQMRAMSTSFQSEMRQALHDPEDPLVTTLADLHPAQVRRNVRRAVTDTLAPFSPAPVAGPSIDPAPRPGLPPAANLPPGPSRPAPDDPAFN